MYKRIFAGAMASLLALGMLLGGCSKKEEPASEPEATLEQTEAPVPSEEPEATAEPTEATVESAEPEAVQVPEAIVTDYDGTIRIAALKGPTGIGMAKLMHDNENMSSANAYDFSLLNAPDEAVAMVSSGSVEIAAVPTNLAAVLDKKTFGSVQVIALNTLGVLHVIEEGDSVKSIKDLSGKTIHASGQGATPEYVLQYLLKENGVTDCQIEWHADHAELATLVSTGEVKLAMLPEPNATVVLNKNSNIRAALDLTKEWDALDTGSRLTMGCVIVNRFFAEANKEAVDAFLSEYQQSIQYAIANPEDAGEFVERFEIMPSAQIATQAIPRCNLVFIVGEEMKEALEGFYQVLFEADPSSVGGELPDESFYYQK